MKREKNEVEQDDAIINLQVAALPPSKPSNLSVPTCSPGNLADNIAGIEFEDHDWELTIRELQLRMQYHIEGIASLKSEKVITDLEELAEKLEKLSKLNKRLRKYKKSEPSETWSSRWVASPIAYLFPPERREEWLADLYEVNGEMLHKSYPRWQVNLNNLGKIVILIISALKIKLSDLLSLAKVSK